jgi:hypothetical protein
LVTNRGQQFSIARNGAHPIMGIKKGILENKQHLILIRAHYIANLPTCNEIEIARSIT